MIVLSFFLKLWITIFFEMTENDGKKIFTGMVRLVDKKTGTLKISYISIKYCFVLLAKQMFVSVTRCIFVLCHHTIVNLFVSKPELNGGNLPNLDMYIYFTCPLLTFIFVKINV
jgi:hypothetical protein